MKLKSNAGIDINIPKIKKQVDQEIQVFLNITLDKLIDQKI